MTDVDLTDPIIPILDLGEHLTSHVDTDTFIPMRVVIGHRSGAGYVVHIGEMEFQVEEVLGWAQQIERLRISPPPKPTQYA